MKGTIDQLHKRKQARTKNFGKDWCKHSKAKNCESTK
jgi:hypothetical protein